MLTQNNEVWRYQKTRNKPKTVNINYKKKISEMKIQETKRRSHRRHISRLCLLLIVFTPVFHSLSLSFCPVPSRSFLGIRHTYRKSLKIFILFLSINENKTSKSNPKNKILHYHHYLSYCKQAIFASCIPEIIDLIGTRAKYGGTLKNEKGRR